MMTAKELIEHEKRKEIRTIREGEEYCQPAPLGVVDRRSYGIVLST